MDSQSLATDRLSELQQKHVPSKVHDSISARIDELPPNAALTLKVLASIGRESSFVLLEHIFPWEAFQEYGFVEHKLGIHYLEEKDTVSVLAQGEEAESDMGRKQKRSTSFSSLLEGAGHERVGSQAFGDKREHRPVPMLVRRAEKIISILRILVQECFIDVGLIMGRRGKGSSEGLFGKPENEVRWSVMFTRISCPYSLLVFLRRARSPMRDAGVNSRQRGNCKIGKKHFCTFTS